MTGFETWSASHGSDVVDEQVARAPVAERQGTVLPILHALQNRFGFIHSDAVGLIATALNLSRAEIFGTISFYHDFRSEPAGEHVLKLCRAEACQALGAVAIYDHCRRTLGVDWHGTTSDGRITVEPVFCLGLCAVAPAALLDERPLARLTAAKLDALVEEVRA